LENSDWATKLQAASSGGNVMMRLSLRGGCFIMERFGLTLSHG
jgi:hypothetical protein